MTASSAGAADGRVVTYSSDSASGDCTTLTGASFGIGERVPIAVPTDTTVHLTFPTPLGLDRFQRNGQR